jgi:hypothetical protein
MAFIRLKNKEKGGEPKKVGSGYVLYAVQRVSKTASKAAKNSGQSPRDLLCTGKIVVEVVEELPCVSSPTPSLLVPPSKPIGSVRGALHLHSIWMDNCRRSLKSCCLFSNRSCPPPSETEAEDAAFPSLVASYYRPRPIFQVQASRELA